MADLSNQSTAAFTIEATSGTYNAPSNSDLIMMSDLRVTIDGLTTDVREFTGSIHRPGPSLLGKIFTMTGKLYLRGPGGSTPPAADTWIPGRILRAVGFAETIVSTAVPASPEAVGSSASTSAAVLGSTASTTNDIYKNNLLSISALGAAGRARLTPVRSYAGGSKTAALMEAAAANITAGTWQLVPQLGYVLGTATPPTLSASVWIGARRYNGVGLGISSWKINMPAAGRESQELPSIEFTLTGDVASVVDQACPVPPAGLAIPPFRDGKLITALARIGGSSVSIDFGAQVAYPPNPNKTSGNDPAQLTETTRVVDINLTQTSLAAFDDVAMSDAQTNWPLFAMWGLGSGNAFCLSVTDMRFAPRSPDNSGAYVKQTGQAWIDGADKTIALTIPFTTF